MIRTSGLASYCSANSSQELVDMAVRAKWELSVGAFEQLLGTLSPDRDVAGQTYETIRAGLLRFFARRVGAEAESLVDQTIDRVCRRIHEGEVVERAGPYFLAVARNVLREHVKTARRRESLAVAAATEDADIRAVSTAHENVQPHQVHCLRECLHRLTIDERALVQQYYGVSGSEGTIRQRRTTLAQQMGITPGNLRVRAHRVRRRMEACYHACVGRCAGLSLEARRERGDRE
jgi:DNA-directed RNA polymerase specialized sigma24 family protein